MLIKGFFAIHVYDFLKKVHLYMSIQDYMAIRDLRVARLQQLLYQNLYHIPMFKYDFFFVYNLQKYEICAQRNALEKHLKIYYIFYKYENLRIVFFIFPYEYPRL